MSALQHAVTVNLQAQFEANLAFLRQRFPIEEWIAGVDGALFAVDDEGRIELNVDGFQGDRLEYERRARALYLNPDNPYHEKFRQVNVGYLTDHRNVVMHDQYDCFYSYIEPPLRKGLLDRFAALCPEDDERSGHLDFGVRRMPVAIVFAGLTGWLLDRVVDDWEIRNLVVVFGSAERLKASLYFTDYPALFDRLTAHGDTLTLLFDDDAEQLAQRLGDVVAGLWPPYIHRGSAVFLADQDVTLFRRVWDEYNQRLWVHYRCWGFLDDEIIGIAHAARNLRKGLPLFAPRADALPADAQVVIIGNGPSLDLSEAFLRDIQSRAVLVSCGSAITALARKGIRPDMHLEIERTRYTFSVLTDATTRPFLQDIPLVMLPVVPPEVFSLSDRSYLFLKARDSGSALYDWMNTRARLRTAPTCTNGALSLMLAAGFKRVYLVGMDMGFHDPRHHHSRESLYHAGCELENPDDLDRILEAVAEDVAQTEETAGNFCPTVLTTTTFKLARLVLEVELEQYAGRGVEVFNLSDGALIKGAEPLRPEDALGREAACTKAEMLTGFWDQFDTAYLQEEGGLQNLTWLADQLAAVHQDLSALFAPALSDKMDVVDRVMAMHTYLIKPGHKGAPVYHLIWGGLLHMGRVFFDAFGVMKNEPNALIYARQFFDSLLQMVDEARLTLLRLKAEEAAAGDEA